MHDWLMVINSNGIVQYDIMYNNIYTEIVICNVNVQYAMLLHASPV